MAVDSSPLHENDGADGDSTMLSIMSEYADLRPNNIFLVETAEDKLTYNESWFLISRLIPERLRSITTNFSAEALEQRAEQERNSPGTPATALRPVALYLLAWLQAVSWSHRATHRGLVASAQRGIPVWTARAQHRFPCRDSELPVMHRWRYEGHMSVVYRNY